LQINFVGALRNIRDVIPKSNILEWIIQTMVSTAEGVSNFYNAGQHLFAN